MRMRAFPRILKPLLKLSFAILVLFFIHLRGVEARADDCPPAAQCSSGECCLDMYYYCYVPCLQEAQSCRDDCWAGTQACIAQWCTPLEGQAYNECAQGCVDGNFNQCFPGCIAQWWSCLCTCNTDGPSCCVYEMTFAIPDACYR
jgi:hypothetical protein